MRERREDSRAERRTVYRYASAYGGRTGYDSYAGGRFSSERGESATKRTVSQSMAAAGRKKHSSTSQVYAGKSRRRIDWQKVLLLVILSAAIFAAGFGVCSVVMPSGTAMVEANEQLSDVKYKVVEIKQGDTLWSIAEENMSPGYSDIFEYIDEIKTCNQLQCNEIRSGNYLMLPYYETIS